MTVSDGLPKLRLKIKFSCKTTQVNENCDQNVSPVRRSSVKRGPSGVIDNVLNKRQKMDRSLKRYCGNILEALIKHPTSWGFCEPVDPVKLNIPDYFLVISKPMDLGTVRTKLQNNMYFTVAEFKDDVKLTFSNAMRYNPSGNFFHKNAMTLDTIFNTKWKSLEVKLKRESLSREQSCLTSFRELQKTTETTRHLCPRESPVGLAPMMSLSFEEKRKLTKDPGEAMPGKVTNYVKISNARPANEEAAARKIQNSRCPGKVLRKGTISGNRGTCGSVKTIASFNVVATRCGSCGSLKCECCPQKGYAYESSNNLPSERCTGQNCVASKMEHESSLTSNTCKSDPRNLRQEKEKVARIEDQIRAELRLRREREREAARLALEKMEKTVEIEDNMKALKELETILFKARQGDRFGNMMERIGLFLKNDYMDYEDEEDGLFLQDWEEGQICN